MSVELKTIKYIDYKVYNVTAIKNKFGFRVLLTLDDNTKKTVQHSGITKREEAEKEKYKVIAQLEMGTYVVYTTVTVKTYMEYWYDFVLTNRLKSEGSFVAYRNCVFNHIIPNIGNLKLVDLKKGHIKKLYKQIFDYSPSVSRLLQTVISTALKDAVTKKFIPTNVAEGIKLPNKDESKKKKQRKNKKMSSTIVIIHY